MEWCFLLVLACTLLSMSTRLALEGIYETTSMSAPLSSSQTSLCTRHVGSRRIHNTAFGWESSRSGSNMLHLPIFAPSTSRIRCLFRSSWMSNLRASSSESNNMRHSHNGTSAYTGSVDVDVFTKSSYTSFSAEYCTFFGERERRAWNYHSSDTWLVSRYLLRGMAISPSPSSRDVELQ